MKQTLILMLLAALVGGCAVVGHGRSTAHNGTVKDGQLLLLRKGNAIAALSFTRQQHGNPDVAEFNWVYRDDGGTLLDPALPEVQSGHSTTVQSRVEIKSLHMGWSYASSGRGYVYYDFFPRGQSLGDAWAISVTDLQFKDLPLDAKAQGLHWQQKP